MGVGVEYGFRPNWTGRYRIRSPLHGRFKQFVLGGESGALNRISPIVDMFTSALTTNSAGVDAVTDLLKPPANLSPGIVRGFFEKES
jgi:hypothetical protein